MSIATTRVLDIAEMIITIDSLTELLNQMEDRPMKTEKDRPLEAKVPKRCDLFGDMRSPSCNGDPPIIRVIVERRVYGKANLTWSPMPVTSTSIPLSCRILCRSSSETNKVTFSN